MWLKKERWIHIRQKEGSRFSTTIYYVRSHLISSSILPNFSYPCRNYNGVHSSYYTNTTNSPWSGNQMTSQYSIESEDYNYNTFTLQGRFLFSPSWDFTTTNITITINLSVKSFYIFYLVCCSLLCLHTVLGWPSYHSPDLHHDV